MHLLKRVAVGLAVANLLALATVACSVKEKADRSISVGDK